MKKEIKEKSKCYFCGNKDISKKIRTSESPKDNYGFLVRCCKFCYENIGGLEWKEN